MATIFRPTLRTAVLATSAAGLTYTTYTYTKPTYTSKMTAHAESSEPSTMQWKGFTTLTLSKSEQVSPNVKHLTFQLPEPYSKTDLQPVTSLLSQHTPEGSWIPVFRPYTPCSPPHQENTVEFLIKKYPGGRASSKMHDLKPGETMKFRPLPKIEYAYKPNEHTDLLLIAGGSGITPIWQLIRTIVENPKDQTNIALVYANNSTQDILLRSEIEALETKHPDRFRKVFTVSQDPADSSVQKGYITSETIGTVWPGKKPGQKVKVFVSGPPAMTESVAGKKGWKGWSQGSVGGVLAELGYQDSDVFKF